MGRPLIHASRGTVPTKVMRASTPLILAAVMLVSGGPTAAAEDPLTGAWAVQGKVSAFHFDLICRFEQRAGAIGGVCYDAGSGKPHPLIRGALSGNHVSWTYQSSYLFKTFDATYSGTLAGASIKGDLAVPGYTGQFSAEKQP